MSSNLNRPRGYYVRRYTDACRDYTSRTNVQAFAHQETGYEWLIEDIEEVQNPTPEMQKTLEAYDLGLTPDSVHGGDWWTRLVPREEIETEPDWIRAKAYVGAVKVDFDLTYSEAKWLYNYYGRWPDEVRRKLSF